MGQGMYGVGAATGINSSSTFTGVVECEEGYYCSGTRRSCGVWAVSVSSCLSTILTLFFPLPLPLYIIVVVFLDGKRTECGSRAVYCPKQSSRPLPARSGWFTDGGASVNTASKLILCPLGSYCIGGEKRKCPAGSYGGVQGLDTSRCSGQCQVRGVCVFLWCVGGVGLSTILTLFFPLPLPLYPAGLSLLRR